MYSLIKMNWSVINAEYILPFKNDGTLVYPNAFIHIEMERQ